MEPSSETVDHAQSTGASSGPPAPPSASQGTPPSTQPPQLSHKAARSPLALVVVAFVVALMLYFGYHQARRSAASAPRLTQSSLAPDFSLESLDGKTMRLSDFRGKAVLLNFWATWCEPCVVELPSLLQLHHEQPNLVILAVSIDDDAATYSRFLVRHHVDLITVRDPSESAAQLYHTDMWPETYLIDRNGIIRRKFVGPQDWTSPEIRNYLNSL